MKANVYLKNLVNGEEINYGEVWQIKKYSVKKLKKMTDEEKLSKAVMVCKRLNALVQKRYWKHTPQYEYIARVEQKSWIEISNFFIVDRTVLIRIRRGWLAKYFFLKKVLTTYHNMV